MKFQKKWDMNDKILELFANNIEKRPKTERKICNNSNYYIG